MAHFLSIVNSVLKFENSVSTSTGSSDADKLISTNSSGKIDESFFVIPTWINLTFTNNWGNYGAPWQTGQYRKWNNGKVEFRGLIKKSSGTPNLEEVITTLPVGYRPPSREPLPALSSNDGKIAGRLDIDASGNLLFIFGVPDYISLSGISFYI